MFRDLNCCVIVGLPAWPTIKLVGLLQLGARSVVFSSARNPAIENAPCCVLLGEHRIMLSTVVFFERSGIVGALR